MRVIERIVAEENGQRALLTRLRDSGEPVVIYGAGVYAYVLKRFLAANGIPVAAVMVDPAHRSDDHLLDSTVSTTEEVAARLRDCHVIVGIVNYPAFVTRAVKLGAREVHVVDVPDYLNMPAAFMDRAFVEENGEQFDQAAGLFADELSRETYIAAINTKINENLAYIRPYVRLDRLYFPAAEVPLRKDEVLLDVGGFTGDTVREFHEISHGRYARIISLEPGEENFAKLKSTIDTLCLSRVVALRVGAWDEKATLRFATKDMHIDNQISKDGVGQIEVDTIDSILGKLESKVTLMKLDINGAEYRAICGARATIQTHLPKVVLRLHTKEDFFRLPILLKELAPDMKLYLRQRNFMSMMLVLYGVFHSV